MFSVSSLMPLQIGLEGGPEEKRSLMLHKMYGVVLKTRSFIACLTVPGLCKHHIVNRLLIL